MAPNKYLKSQPAQNVRLLNVLHALSDPVRLEIVLKLANEGEVPCRSFGFDLHKSSLSHHFMVLREAGMIASRRKGRETVQSIRKEDIEAQFPGLLEAVIVAAR